MLIHRHILDELLTRFLLCFFGFSGIFLVGQLLEQLHKETGIGLDLLITVVPYVIPAVLTLAIPVSLLLACAMVYGRMASDNELTALRASGMNLYSALQPAVLLGLGFTLVLVYNHTELAPESRMVRQAMARSVLRDLTSTARLGQQGMPLQNWTVYFEDVESGEVRNLTVVVMAPGGKTPVQQFIARRGRLDLDEATGKIRVSMEEGTAIFYESPKAEPAAGTGVQAGPFQRYTLEQDISLLLQTDRKLGMLRLGEIFYLLDGGKAFGGMRSYKPNELLTELHLRYGQAFAPLFFALLGALGGIVARRGSFLVGLGSGCLPALVTYYPLTFLAHALGSRGGTLHPGTIVWGLLGGYLLVIAAAYRRLVRT